MWLLIHPPRRWNQMSVSHPSVKSPAMANPQPLLALPVRVVWPPGGPIITVQAKAGDHEARLPIQDGWQV